jgi:hypothetical protein
MTAPCTLRVVSSPFFLFSWASDPAAHISRTAAITATVLRI